MTAPLPLRCHCGTVTGELRAGGVRLRCYCTDCRGAAHHLGVADRALLADGAAPILVTSAGALSIRSGHDQLAALRCTPKGPLRWYARCCNTPIGNTLAAPGIPFLSISGACWPAADEVDRALGTGSAGIFGADANTDVDAHPRTPPTVLARIAWHLGRARLRGEHRCNPFDGAPANAITLLSREQRRAAHAAAGA